MRRPLTPFWMGELDMREHDSGFDYKAELERFTARLVREIRSPRRRKHVKQEYAEHMDDIVYHRMLSGESEAAAFRAACEEIGEASKISELLAAVHNRDKMPGWVRFVLLLALGIGVLISYFAVNNYVYRTWVVFLAQLVLLVLCVFLAVAFIRLLACLRIRKKAIKKLKAYAKVNDLKLVQCANGYKSIFARQSCPEFYLETRRARYIISFWTTFWRIRHLRLLDVGLYTYSHYVGYAMLGGPGQMGGSYGMGRGFMLPIFREWAKKIGLPLWHTDLVEVPQGMHLIPKIEWEDKENPEKKNVRVLLLNPVPYKITGVEKGQPKPLGDDTTLGEWHIYSMTGLVSFLEGERISKGKL